MRPQCTIRQMSVRPRYPLEPLRALRAGEHRARTPDLAGALAEERVAAEALRAAEARRDAAAARLATARAGAEARVARGQGMTAAALAASEAHARELRTRLAAEEAAV